MRIFPKKWGSATLTTFVFLERVCSAQKLSAIVALWVFAKVVTSLVALSVLGPIKAFAAYLTRKLSLLRVLRGNMS